MLPGRCLLPSVFHAFIVPRLSARVLVVSRLLRLAQEPRHDKRRGGLYGFGMLAF